jgi:hypothetical protein
MTSPARITTGRQPLAQDYSVIWHNPDPEYYVEGSGLLHRGGGEWLAVVPVVPRVEWSAERRAAYSRTHLVRSLDGGQSWTPIAELPYYSAVPFQHGESVYLFAMTGGTQFRNDDLLLLRSDDGGHTWSDPITLFAGHFWNCHTGMVIREQRLYWAVDDLSYGRLRGPRIVTGDLTADLMTPSAWRLSNPVPFPGIPDALINPRFADRNQSSQYLEPNVIEVNGAVRVLATVKPNGQTTTGLCAVLDVTDNGGSVELAFTQYHPMPGGQLKFCVIWDEVSRLFWATVNLAVDGQGRFESQFAAGDDDRRFAAGGNDRRFLMLMYGMDGLNWFPAGCVARAGRLEQSFMYARPVIDGDDLGIISRTSVAAPNRHDADHATFHRVRNFRALAMSLWPEAE